jgi:hypothetical protein
VARMTPRSTRRRLCEMDLGRIRARKPNGSARGRLATNGRNLLRIQAADWVLVDNAKSSLDSH